MESNAVRITIPTSWESEAHSSANPAKQRQKTEPGLYSFLFQEIWYVPTETIDPGHQRRQASTTENLNLAIWRYPTLAQVVIPRSKLVEPRLKGGGGERVRDSARFIDSLGLERLNVMV